MTKIVQGKLDERFIVSWPDGLKVAVPQLVVVRIAANKYEDLLADIAGPGRKVKMERFQGEAKLEVTLTPDSGLEVVRKHSDVQVVVEGKPHREWLWSVWPKATGLHQLNLLVRGFKGTQYEDYDPETAEYNVAFNFSYWFINGIQQNGISWLWALMLMLTTALVTNRLTLRATQKKPTPPSSTTPEPPKPDSQSQPPLLE